MDRVTIAWILFAAYILVGIPILKHEWGRWAQGIGAGMIFMCVLHQIGGL